MTNVTDLALIINAMTQRNTVTARTAPAGGSREARRQDGCRCSTHPNRAAPFIGIAITDLAAVATFALDESAGTISLRRGETAPFPLTKRHESCYNIVRFAGGGASGPTTRRFGAWR